MVSAVVFVLRLSRIERYWCAVALARSSCSVEATEECCLFEPDEPEKQQKIHSGAVALLFS